MQAVKRLSVAMDIVSASLRSATEKTSAIRPARPSCQGMTSFHTHIHIVMFNYMMMIKM